MADSRQEGYEYEFVESVKDLHKCPTNEGHLLHCPEKKESCDCCQQLVMFDKSQEHTIQCAFYKTDCLFAPIGCSEKIERRSLKSHHQESTEKHLNMLTLAALRLYAEGDFVSEEGADVTYELPGSLLAKFAEMKDKNVAVLSSVVKPSDPVSYHSLEHSMTALKKTIELLKSDNAKLQKEVSFIMESNVAMKAYITDLIGRVNELIRGIDETKVSPDKTDVTGEMPLDYPMGATASANSQFCPYLWHVDIARCMGADSHFSPSFYSWEGGYKFYLTLNYDGLENGQHAWLFECFLTKGDYDRNLSWPFPEILKFTVRRKDNMRRLSKYKCNYNGNKGRRIKRRQTPIFYRYVDVSLEDMTSELVVEATLDVL